MTICWCHQEIEKDMLEGHIINDSIVCDEDYALHFLY